MQLLCSLVITGVRLLKRNNIVTHKSLFLLQGPMITQLYMLLGLTFSSFFFLAPVVQKLDCAIDRINRYLLDKC